jgi:hypothetical protein
MTLIRKKYMLIRASEAIFSLGEPKETISNPYLHEFNKAQNTHALKRASEDTFSIGEP